MIVLWLFWLAELAVFVPLWTLVLWLTWAGLKIFCFRFISQDRRVSSILATLVTICVFFELMATFQIELAHQTAVLSKGAPYSCQIPGKSWLESVQSFWKREDSCEEFYRKSAVNIFWRLNPLKVYCSLLFGTVGHAFALTGKATGGYLNELFNNLPWFYHLPVLICLTCAALLAILSYSGYEFSAFWSMLRIHKPVPVEPSKPVAEDQAARRPKIVTVNKFKPIVFRQNR